MPKSYAFRCSNPRCEHVFESVMLPMGTVRCPVCGILDVVRLEDIEYGDVDADG